MRCRTRPAWDGSASAYGMTVLSFKELVFQDVRRGDRSENRLYYMPIDQIGTAAEFAPIKLPPLFFRDLRENIQLDLSPALP